MPKAHNPGVVDVFITLKPYLDGTNFPCGGQVNIELRRRRFNSYTVMVKITELITERFSANSGVPRRNLN